MEELGSSQSSEHTSETEEGDRIENDDSNENSAEKDVIDPEALRLAKERAENSNKISKALIVFGYSSWLQLEPSKSKNYLI